MTEYYATINYLDTYDSQFVNADNPKEAVESLERQLKPKLKHASTRINYPISIDMYESEADFRSNKQAVAWSVLNAADWTVIRRGAL